MRQVDEVVVSVSVSFSVPPSVLRIFAVVWLVIGLEEK